MSLPWKAAASVASPKDRLGAKERNSAEVSRPNATAEKWECGNPHGQMGYASWMWGLDPSVLFRHRDALALSPSYLVSSHTVPQSGIPPRKAVP